MAGFQQILFVSLALLLFSQSIDGLTCWKCTNCAEPFPTSNHSACNIFTESSNEPGYCVKIWTPVAVLRKFDKTCIQGDIKGTGTFCCQTDFCNDATRMISSMTLWTSLAVILFRKFF